MEEFFKNKFFWLVLIFTLTNLGFFVFSKVIIDKAADAVIEKLQKEYSPSPYGPGFDPDRADIDTLKNQRLYLQLQQHQENSEVFEKMISTPDSEVEQKVKFADGEIKQKVRFADEWRDGWEKDRGFILAQ